MTKSIRLNKTIRSEILKNITEAWVNNNPRPENKEDTVVADLKVAVVEQYKEDHKEVISLYNTGKYNNYLRTTSKILAHLPDSTYCRLYFSEDQTEKLPTLDTRGAYYNLKDPNSYKGKEIISKAVEVYTSKKKELRKNRKEVSDWDNKRLNYQSSIEQVLQGVNTSKQLLEIWPEVEKFIPQGYVNPSKINLPAVNFEEINKQLG